MSVVWRISAGIAACFYLYYAVVVARYGLGFTAELHVDTIWQFLAFGGAALGALARATDDRDAAS